MNENLLLILLLTFFLTVPYGLFNYFYKKKFKEDFKILVNDFFGNNSYYRGVLSSNINEELKKKLESFFNKEKNKLEILLIDKYRDNLRDKYLDSEGFSTFCIKQYKKIIKSSNDEESFLKSLNSLIYSENSSLFSFLEDSELKKDIQRNFRNNVCDIYYKTHELIDEYDFEENNKSGIYERWHNNGQKSIRKIFEMGELIEINEWWSDGIKKEEGKLKNGEWLEFHREWYRNGVLKEEWITNKKQQCTRWSHYHSNGQLKRESNYKNGLYHGLHHSYKPDGKICYYEPWENNKRHGLCKYHTENIYSEINYVNGIKHGIYKSYDSKGNLFYETMFKNGSGIKKRCDYKGNLSYTSTEINGELVSESSYYSKGKKEMERIWKDGKMVSEKFWDREGLSEQRNNFSENDIFKIR
tara:strand:+ start:1402 stop:2640 length:1239 start_codon:yes stop_codon:yes gene_type:complete